MKKSSGVLVSVLMAVVLVACGESVIETVDEEVNAGVNEVEATNNANESVVENEPEEEEAGEEAEIEEVEVTEEEVVEEDGLGVGDTVNFNGLELTLKGVRTSLGEEYFEPDNDFFLILDLSAVNTTDEEASVSSLMQMSLVDPDGYSQDIDIFADTKGSMDGEIGAGRTMAGEVSFDVQDADFYEFIFEELFMSGQAIWTIESSDWE